MGLLSRIGAGPVQVSQASLPLSKEREEYDWWRKVSEATRRDREEAARRRAQMEHNWQLQQQALDRMSNIQPWIDAMNRAPDEK